MSADELTARLAETEIDGAPATNRHIAKTKSGRAVVEKKTKDSTAEFTKIKLKTHTEAHSEAPPPPPPTPSTYYTDLFMFLTCSWSAPDENENPPTEVKAGGGGTKKKGLDNLRNQAVTKPCALCNQSILTSAESHRYRGSDYHKKCFACTACNTSLIGAGLEWSNDNHALPYCGRCFKTYQLRQSHMTASTGNVCLKGKTAAEAGAKHRASTEGDIDGVLDLIGDELESALVSMVPRCEICGDPFSATDEIIMGGMSKFHKVCQMGGRPTTSAISPRQACLSLADLLTVKVKVGEKPFTFFFTKSETQVKVAQRGADKNAPVDITYDPDDAPNAKRKRPVPPGFGEDSTCVIELAGGDYDCVPATVSMDCNGTLSGAVSTTKKQITYRVSPTFHWCAERDEFEAISLVVTVSKDE